MSMRIKFMQAEKIEFAINQLDKLSNGTFIWANDTERFYIKMKDKLIGITPKRRELLEFKCKNCGATLSNKSDLGSFVKCEFCGSIYETDNWTADVE